MDKAEKIIFTEEELKEMVRLHDEEGLLNREIADIFGVSKMTINRRLKDMGVKSRHPKLNEEREKWICDLYQKHQNIEDVRKIANVSGQTVSMLLDKYNIPKLSNSEVHRKYSINSSYFNDIDTSNKAYVLGLLFSDGTISPIEKHVFRLSLQENDKKILEKILIDMKSTHPLRFISYHDKNPNWSNQYFFDINDKELCQGLYSHGMYPNKSLTVEYPINIPSEFDKDFIRGLMDGDGYISKTGHHISITGTIMILSKIQEIITTNLNINSSIRSYSRNPNSVTKDLNIYGRNQAYKFLNWIYEGAEMYIDRKYNLYISEYKNKVA